MDAALEAGRYLHWGVVSISVTNLLVVLIMVAVFILALVVPFPGHRRHRGRGPTEGGRS